MREPSIDLAALGRALEETLATLPEAVLEPFAAQRKLLGGGYRKGHPALLRALVANALRPRLLSYDADTASFLRAHMPEARLLSMLSREVLDSRKNQWMAFFGKARFLLALLADPREEVRERVPEWMAAEGTELPEAEAAADLLAQAFSPVVRMGGEGPAARDRDREKLATLRQQLEAAEKARREERRTAEEAAKAAAREQASQLATARFGIQERQRTIDRLEAALRREAAERERRIKAALAERQVKLFHGWLSPSLTAEALAADPRKPLLERAEAALAQQHRLDRTSALRAELSGQLGAIEATLRQVDDTLAGALVRHPELVAIRAELVAERDRLHEGLNHREATPLVATLTARIHAATDTDYEPTLSLLKLVGRLGLISKADEAHLRHLFHQRIATWSLCQGVSAKEADLAMAALESECAAAERRNPDLVKALCGTAPAMLFLDGHNILNGIGRYRLRRGVARSHEEARAGVEHDIAQLLRHLPQTFAHVVWDGINLSQHDVADNVMVHYSGGEGEHRADRYILDQLRYYRDTFPYPRILITDDNGFAGEALKLGASVCRLHDFEAFLNGPPAP